MKFLPDLNIPYIQKDYLHRYPNKKKAIYFLTSRLEWRRDIRCWRWRRRWWPTPMSFSGWKRSTASGRPRTEGRSTRLKGRPEKGHLKFILRSFKVCFQSHFQGHFKSLFKRRSIRRSFMNSILGHCKSIWKSSWFVNV